MGWGNAKEPVSQCARVVKTIVQQSSLEFLPGSNCSQCVFVDFGLTKGVATLICENDMEGEGT